MSLHPIPEEIAAALAEYQKTQQAIRQIAATPQQADQIISDAKRQAHTTGTPLLDILKQRLSDLAAGPREASRYGTPHGHAFIHSDGKRPVVIEAVQWWEHGDHHGVGELRRPEPEYEGEATHELCGRRWREHGWVDTLEGGHIACPGDWIITGIQGEHYPCKPDIFEATYQPADEDATEAATVTIGGDTTFRPDLHSRNPKGYQQCDWCKSRCHDGAWCVCCAADEVETLRSTVQRLSDARHGSGPYPWHCPACAALHDALDGGDE